MRAEASRAPSTGVGSIRTCKGDPTVDHNIKVRRLAAGALRNEKDDWPRVKACVIALDRIVRRENAVRVGRADLNSRVHTREGRPNLRPCSLNLIADRLPLPSGRHVSEADHWCPLIKEVTFDSAYVCPGG